MNGCDYGYWLADLLYIRAVCPPQGTDHLWIILENLRCVSKVGFTQVMLHAVISVWCCSSPQRNTMEIWKWFAGDWVALPTLQVGNRVPKSWAALSESSQNNCYSMQLGVLLFCYLCFLVSRAKRNGEKSNLKIISTHNQGEVFHILPACTKRNLCTFFSFFMEKSFNSLTIYFNHVVANTTRLDEVERQDLKLSFNRSPRLSKSTLRLIYYFHCTQ